MSKRKFYICTRMILYTHSYFTKKESKFAHPSHLKIAHNHFDHQKFQNYH